jgi:hypothetical protein
VVRPDARAPECGLHPPQGMPHQGVDVGKHGLELRRALLDLQHNVSSWLQIHKNNSNN